MNQGLPSSKSSSWPSSQAGSLSSASASSSTHRNTTVEKLLTKEPNNSKELQIKANTKQLGSTGKERRNRASKKEQDRGIRDRPNDPRQQMNIPRLGGETCRDDHRRRSSDDGIENGEWQNIPRIFYGRTRENGARTG